MAVLRKLNSQSAALDGEFSNREASFLRQEVERLIEQNREGVLSLHLADLSGVNSALISLLLCAMRYAQQHHCRLIFTGAPKKLFDMARVGGVESILPFEK